MPWHSFGWFSRLAEWVLWCFQILYKLYLKFSSIFCCLSLLVIDAWWTKSESVSGIFDLSHLRFLQKRSNPGEDGEGYMVDVDKVKFSRVLSFLGMHPLGITQFAYFNFVFLVSLFWFCLLVRQLRNHWLSLKHEVSGDVPFRMSHVDVM